jgi:hypothetical protein
VDDTDSDFEQAEGRSSRVGGSIPSSVYSQSICTMVVDNWLSRFAWSDVSE